MLHAHGQKGVGMNIYGEVLRDDMIGLTTENTMEQYFQLKLQSKNALNKLKKIISKSIRKPILNFRVTVKKIMVFFNTSFIEWDSMHVFFSKTIK